MKQKDFKYDVVLSFAGEQRQYVEKLIEYLKEKDIEYFYDEENIVDLWGKELIEYFADIYQNKGEYCVMFISKEYKDKLWTKHERKNALVRAFNNDKEYILPIRFDDTELPGLLSTIQYLDSKKYSIDKIADTIIQKVKGFEAKGTLTKNILDIPKIKRTFSNKEKIDFILSSFEYIENLFRISLKEFENKNSHVKTIVRHTSDSEFICDVFVSGEIKKLCRIWINKQFSNIGEIAYYEGTNALIHKDALNDFATVIDDGYELFFEISNMGSIDILGVNLKKASSFDLAKHYWNKFLKSI